MSAMAIWIGAIVIYALFWAWYVGFGGKIAPQLADQAIAAAQKENPSEEQLDSFRQFLGSDDGKEFIMYNAVHLAEPLEESRRKLDIYSKAFMGSLFKKAGHPVFTGRALSGNLETKNAEFADDWTAGALVRYRSRTDFARMVIQFAGADEHLLKLEALEKTFAFPTSPMFLVGGPRLIVALVVALIAALIQSIAATV